MKVAIQNDNVCEYAELSVDIKFTSDKLPTGSFPTITSTFVVRNLGVGKSAFAVSYFPAVSCGTCQVQEVLSVTGSCPKEDAERIRIEEAKHEEKRRKISDIQKKYKSLGFKGLHLGMTRDDLNILMENNDFTWKTFYGGSINEETALLNCFSCNIGCVGKGETESCYKIDYGYVEFYNNKIIRIGIQSPSYSARDIDPYLISWAKFAKHGLSTKYSNPTRSPLPVERINIFSFKENYYIPMYVWTKGSSEISINLTHSEYKYYVDILYDDSIGIQAKKNEKKKSRKIEF